MYLSSFDHLINLAHSKKGMGETRHHKADGGPVSTAGDIEKQSQYGSAFYAPTAADDTSYMNPQTGPAMLTGGAPKAKGGQVRRRCHKEYGGDVDGSYTPYYGGPADQAASSMDAANNDGLHTWARGPARTINAPIAPGASYNRRGGEVRRRRHKDDGGAVSMGGGNSPYYGPPDPSAWAPPQRISTPTGDYTDASGVHHFATPIPSKDGTIPARRGGSIRGRHHKK